MVRLNGHEFGQSSGGSEDRRIWHAAVHGLQRVGQDLATKQQQQHERNQHTVEK